MAAVAYGSRLNILQPRMPDSWNLWGADAKLAC
jgi:hypothetical protein